jgi:hypothetical protein
MKPESEALIAAADSRGNLLMPMSPDSQHARLCHDIEHYFDANMEELGYILYPGSPYEAVIRFDPPRIWCDNFLESLVWTKLIKS